MTKTNLKLNTKIRTVTGKKVSVLRQTGKIPAILYGHGVKPVKLEVDYSQFEKIYKQAGDSTLIDLTVDDKSPVKVLVQDYQLDHLSNRYTHVDFHQVRMDEKLHTDITLKFVGEAPAIKSYSGILVTNLNAVAVECLPGDLVHEVQVDLSSLAELDSVLHVTDLKVPKGITILNSPNDVVALIQPPRAEEQAEVVAAPAEEARTQTPAQAADDEDGEQTSSKQ